MPRVPRMIPKEGPNGAGHVRLALRVTPAQKRWLMQQAVDRQTTVSAVVAALVEAAQKGDIPFEPDGSKEEGE